MRILIIKPDHLGDFVLALPSLWELRQKLGSDARIDIISSKENVEWSQILDWLPYIEPMSHPRYMRPVQPPMPLLIELAKQSYSWRDRHYDIAVELSSTTNDWVGKGMMILAGVKKRSGAEGAFDWLLTDKKDQGGGHQTRILSRRFPEEWGITGFAKPEDFMPAKYRHSGKKEGKILLAPWAGTEAKQWPFEHWQGLMAELCDQEVEILSPPNTEERSQALCEGWKNTWVVSTDSIARTLEILSQARLVVGVDSSVAHFAWLTGTPLVELFSGTAEIGRWGSLAQGECLFQKPPCAPCHLRVCSQSKNFCMSDISYREVVEVISKALA